MEEAKQLANVVDLVVSVNYNTLHKAHMMLAGTSPGNARACPGLQPPMPTLSVLQASICPKQQSFSLQRSEFHVTLQQSFRYIQTLQQSFR